MNDPLQLIVKGIKCDNKECDYINEDVKVEDYEFWLNKPCPKCDTNLLTQEDYDNVKTLQDLVDMVKSMIPEGMLKDEPQAIMSVEMDGTGKMKFGQPRLVKEGEDE